MGIASNLFIIVLAMNLMIALAVPAGSEASAPMIGAIKKAMTGNETANMTNVSSSSVATPNIWSYLLEALGKNAVVWGILFLILLGATLALNPVGYYTGQGGGFGIMMVFQILAISLFASLFLVPNFSALGLPSEIGFVLNVIFFGMLSISIVGLLRGYD